MARTFVAASTRKAVAASTAVTAAPLTMACWFKPSNTAGGTSKSLMSIDDGAGVANYFLLRAVGSTGTCSALVANGGASGASTTAAASADGVWAHFAGVFTSSTSRTAYLNGVAATTDTSSCTPASLTQTQIGCLWVSTQCADGDIAEAAIWNVALSAADLAALALGVSPLLVRPDALVFYAPLFGTYSPEIELIGRRDLTVTGATIATHPRIYGSGSRQAFMGTAVPSPGHLNRPVLTVDGIDRSLAYDRMSLEILDDLNELPNTLSCEVFGFVPVVNQSISVIVGTTKEFAGTITSVAEYHDRLNARTVYRVSATDYTRDFDALLVTNAYGSQSATTTAQDIVSNFTSGFTQVHIAAALPTVAAIQFKMTRPSSALRQLCDAFGGDAYVDYDKDVHVFTTETDITPDPIAAATTTSHWRQFRYRQMIDRVANRIFVEGLGTTLAATVAAGDTILPVETIDMFVGAGGSAVIGNQIVTYTGRTEVSPGSAPSAAAASGTGLGTGVYQYKFTFVTALGESLPSAAGSVTTGVLAAPASAPTPATATDGGSVNTGSHDYAVTFVTGSGETTPGSTSAAVTTDSARTLPAPTSSGSMSGTTGGSLTAGSWYGYGVSFVTAGGETTVGGVQANILTGGQNAFAVSLIPTSSHSVVTARNVYRTTAQASSAAAQAAPLFLLHTVPGNTVVGSVFTDTTADGSLGAAAPGSNTATYAANTVPLSVIPLGDASVTSRKLYRRFNGSGTFKLVTTIADNVTTTYDDAIANASLGADAPGSNTAVTTRATITGILVGPSGTTSRKVYRTVVGGSTFKLQSTIADNTTTSLTDSTADGSLGANAPTTDTAGLASVGFSTTSGATSAGASAITLVATTAFASGGGWARVGELSLRYTGKSATQLTGIPVSGIGSISVAIPSGLVTQSLLALTGVPTSGVGALVSDVQVGDDINILIQRDDVISQATYGIRHAYIQDRRLSQAGAAARGDAELTLRKDPYIEGSYVTDDTKVRSGRRVTVSMASEWGLSGTYTISKVRVYWVEGRTMPEREVTFSSNTGDNDLFRILRRLREQQQQQTAS